MAYRAAKGREMAYSKKEKHKTKRESNLKYCVETYWHQLDYIGESPSQYKQ